MIQVSSSLQKFESNVYGFHFPVPTEIAVKFTEGNDRRVVCTINQGIQIQGALMPYSGGYFLMVNQDLVKKLNLSIGDQVNLKLEKDRSEFGMPMPESFRTLLDQDIEGNQYFDQLTPGKKRSLIYLVGKVKNIDSQLNKGLAILDHLKSEAGNIEYKKLNELIKEYNQRNKLK